MTGDRAMRVAVAASEQVAQNAELAAAQRAAWGRFIRVVWGGFPRPTEPTTIVGSRRDRP
jgi:hypothetical protein